MNIPNDRKYVKSHEWAQIEGSTVTVGISDFAQSELGDVVFVDITASPGDELDAGEVFGTIEAVKTVSDLYMPMAGTITEVNESLADAPDAINNDPYGEGWLVRFEAENPDGADLMDGAAYGEMVGA